jgi:hypothetical protein
MEAIKSCLILPKDCVVQDVKDAPSNVLLATWKDCDGYSMDVFEELVRQLTVRGL